MFVALANTLKVVPLCHVVVDLVLMVVQKHKHFVHLLLQVDHLAILLVSEVHLCEHFGIRIIFFSVRLFGLIGHFFEFGELSDFFSGLLDGFRFHCFQVV